MGARLGTKRDGLTGVHPASLHVLHTLDGRPPLTTRSIATLTRRSRKQVLKQLYRLEDRGLVQRMPHGERDALWGKATTKTVVPSGAFRLCTYIDHELGERVKARALETGRSMSAEAAVLIARGLDS